MRHRHASARLSKRVLFCPINEKALILFVIVNISTVWILFGRYDWEPFQSKVVTADTTLCGGDCVAGKKTMTQKGPQNLSKRNKDLDERILLLSSNSRRNSIISPNKTVSTKQIHSNVTRKRKPQIPILSNREKPSNLTVKQFLETNGDRNIFYPTFTIKEPLFIANSDKLLFYKNAKNEQVLNIKLSSEYFRGVVKVIKNGWASETFECGWQTYFSPYETEPETDPVTGPKRVHRQHDFLCPLSVPEGCNLKHFIDGTLPKIIQAFDYLVYREIALLIPGNCDMFVLDLLALLGISRNRIITPQDGYYTSEYQVNTCVTPPFHPSLWNKTRSILNVPKHLEADDKESYVILFGFGYVKNRKLKILNLNQVTQILIKKFTSNRVVVINDFETDVTEIKKFFFKAKVIISIPNDLLYYMLFAPGNTSVIEVMGARSSGQVLPSDVDHTLTWKIASSMGHAYWRVYEQFATDSGDLSIHLAKLKNILEVLEPAVKKGEKGVSPKT